MTNLLTTLTFVLATNWTGHTFAGKELGYVITNHVATVCYETNKHEFTLRSVQSDKAVWREPQALYFYQGNWTNHLKTLDWKFVPNLLQTNLGNFQDAL